jgi:malonate decarboxylase gamma subunit
MSLDELLLKLFGGAARVTHCGAVFSGEGVLNGAPVALFGTAGGAPLSAAGAHTLAGAILKEIKQDGGRPLLILLDNLSQKLALSEELIGNCRYFAHLAQCIDMAARKGRRVIALVYKQAISGGFMAAGMSARVCFALPEAELRVMDLAAMARITKQPLERLKSLQEGSPVFAPGVQNFWALGIIESLWEGDLAMHLAEALDEKRTFKSWRQLGEERGGRTLARFASEAVRSHA